MMRPLSASMLALALAGCVNMAPAHERPSLASAPAYDGEYRPDGTVVASTLSYGEWFDDARLVALIDTAVANNRDLVAATARIEQARAQYLSTVAAQRAFYLSLIADTATTYYEIVETQEQIALAEATAESRREGLRIAKLRLDNGVTSALPFRQAETLLTQAEQQLASEQLALAQLRNQLGVLVGGTVPDALPDGLPLESQADDRRLAAGLPSDLLLVRPDIIAAEEQLRAARANIGAARAAFFPTISLTGNAGFASDSLDDLFSGSGFGWSFGPTISLPIFDWGAREADLDLAKALEVEQVATYDKTVQTAFREVSDALAGRRWLAEQVATLERAVEAQERIARLARLRYREGVADYLEVLDAERNLFSARQQLLATERAWLQNRATLFVALGGGGER